MRFEKIHIQCNIYIDTGDTYVDQLMGNTLAIIGNVKRCWPDEYQRAMDVLNITVPLQATLQDYLLEHEVPPLRAENISHERAIIVGGHYEKTLLIDAWVTLAPLWHPDAEKADYAAWMTHLSNSSNKEVQIRPREQNKWPATFTLFEEQSPLKRRRTESLIRLIAIQSDAYCQAQRRLDKIKTIKREEEWEYAEALADSFMANYKV